MTKASVAVIYLLSWSTLICALPSTIRIGALFNNDTDNMLKIAFRYAVDSVNTNSDVLPRSKLITQMETLLKMDSFFAEKRVCRLLRLSTIAIFGPQDEKTSSHIQSICDALSIPHIETRPDFRSQRDDYSINLYPHSSSLSKAFADIVRGWNWKSYTIIYQHNEGLKRLQKVLSAIKPKIYKISVRQLPAGHDYRLVLNEIKQSGQTNIILDCDTDKVFTVLKQAQQIGMMTNYHAYFITTLDLHTVDLEDFKYGGTNITAFRLVDPNKPEVDRVVHNWMFNELRFGNKDLMTTELLKTETALVYDAVHLFAKALTELDVSQQVTPKSLECDGTDSWPNGNSLVNYMKMVELEGMTGLVKFDTQGFRTNFILDIIQLSKDGLHNIGTWSLSDGVNITHPGMQPVFPALEGSLQNKTLRVTTKLNEPYFMLKNSANKLSGNDQYEGYVVDLMDAIASKLKFNYTLQEVADGNYGAKDETGQWDGMIRELLDDKADIAVVDFTITSERASAVDFTGPFMTLGISLIYTKPMKAPPALFSFLSPFSMDVWVWMAAAYIGVSVVLFLLARISPYEWDNPYPCIEDPEFLENDFGILNSLWFTVGALMQQGTDIAPKAVSTRMVAGMWWFFTLIMISSYTANLAAFLTVETLTSPISSAEDLAKQTKIKYGSLGSGSTAGFFEDSNVQTYKTMWEFMSSHPEVFVKSNTEGLERVQKEKGLYAYFMESTSIEYWVERKCDLRQVGALLDDKGYGMALRPGSPYRAHISSVLLGLREEGTLDKIKKIWWEQKRGGGQCKSASSAGGGGGADELGLANVGGVFVVLMGGMGIAALIAIGEYFFESRSMAEEEGISLKEVLLHELRFAVRCSGSTKPVRKKEAEPLENGVQYGYVKAPMT